MTSIGISPPFAENQLREKRTTQLGQLSDARTDNNNIGIGEGVFEGITSSTTDSIAIGQNVSSDSDTGAKSISLGSAFGSPFDQSTSQNGIGAGSVAIGTSTNGNAGTDLGSFSVMIGGATCYNGSGTDVVSIGKACGATNPPGNNSIQIGTDSGSGTSSAVGASSICIGNQAGLTGAGTDSILIGQGSQGVTNNSIVINSTGSTTASVASGLVIKPIAIGGNTVAGTIKKPNDTNFDHYLAYNATSGEIRAVLHGG